MACAPQSQDGPSATNSSYVAILHKPDGAWRGGFEVPGAVTCAAVAQRTAYFGLQNAPEPLIEVDKSAVFEKR